MANNTPNINFNALSEAFNLRDIIGACIRKWYWFLLCALIAVGIAQYNTMSKELWQDIGAIADNENLMRRLARYAKKLVKEQNDPTLMTKEEYFAKIERAEQQSARGEGVAMLPGEDLTHFLIRNGYAI